MAMPLWRWEDVQRRERDGDLPPIAFTGITDLPEVTYLTPEDGWRQWDLVIALQDAADKKEKP